MVQNQSTRPPTPEPNDWHPADIVAALRKAGWTVRALARAHGISHSSLSRTLGYAPNRDHEWRIAKALRLHPMVIWPSRYAIDGRRLSQVTLRKRNTAVRPGNVQNKSAA